MKGRLCICVFILIFFTTFISPINAGIALIPNLINFTADDPLHTNVTVINEGEEKVYVRVTPQVVLNPGTTKEQKVIIHNPEQYGLLVTPQQLVIPPKERRLIRLMLTRPLDQEERIYQINVVPIAQDIIPTLENKKSSARLGLKMIVGYGILAMVRPTHPQMNLRVYRKGRNLFLSNKGNSNLELSNIKQCADKTCHPIKNFVRLYAGNTYQVALGTSKPTQLMVQLLDEQKIITSN